MKKVFIFLLLLVIGFAWFFGYKEVSANGTEKSIDFIASHINGRGKIVDYQNDLGITSMEDLKWYDNKSDIEIEFGKVRLKIKKDEITSEKVINMLNRINIKIKKIDGEYNVYYGEKKIDLYIR